LKGARKHNPPATDDQINASWMYEVARSFARRSHALAKPGGGGQRKEGASVAAATAGGLLSRIRCFIGRAIACGTGGRAGLGPNSTCLDENNDADARNGLPEGPQFADGRNVIFLTWSIPDLFASNLLAMIPAYYKTVANYDLIVDYVAGSLSKFVDFVELNNEFESERQRARHYAQFQFYGHSLGSHILSDAISRVTGGKQLATTNAIDGPPPSGHFGRPAGLHGPMKFGKLMGLDPATPCFISNEYGISSAKLSEAVHQVVVLHSNAGFAGVPNERADIEIVLNGGTFQPGCVWYDFTCSHVRSTDILSYIDDDCQMVAYKCTSYNHFKLGACQACQSSLLSPSGAGAGDCVLVNLPEQHRDRPQVLAYAEKMSNRTRQLADGHRHPAGAANKRSLSSWLRRANNDNNDDDGPTAATESSRSLVDANATTTTTMTPSKAKMTHFHHVNTNANFRFGRKSHCLQHYQLRLLVYHEDERLRDKCKLSAFYLKSADEIKLKLFYETDLGGELPSGRQQPAVGRSLVAKMFVDSDDPRATSDTIKLNAIVKDVFLTALVNFEAEPRLFVGGQLENLDLAAMRECYERANATSGGPNFLLDIAFMSHTYQK
jgi:hypothetical protein